MAFPCTGSSCLGDCSGRPPSSSIGLIIGLVCGLLFLVAAAVAAVAFYFCWWRPKQRKADAFECTYTTFPTWTDCPQHFEGGRHDLPVCKFVRTFMCFIFETIAHDAHWQDMRVKEISGVWNSLHAVVGEEPYPKVDEDSVQKRM